MVKQEGQDIEGAKADYRRAIDLDSDYGPAQHTDMLHRLRDARVHADLYILTDGLTAEQVALQAAQALAII